MEPRRWFFVLTLVFVLVGLFFIADVSLVEGAVHFGDKFYFLKHQAIWAGLGLFLLGISSRFPSSFWQKIAGLFFWLSLVLLVAVWFPGVGVKAWGARRWVSLGFITFQPAEVAKLGVILLTSRWLANEKENKLNPAKLLLLFLPAGLVVVQPDFGTAGVLLSLPIAIWFIAGAPIKKMLPFLLTIGVVGVLILLASPYRRARIKAFLNPSWDPQGKSYHLRQIILTWGEGGWFGVGLGKSRQKYRYLPETTTDSLLAVVGEEVGFVGISGVILGFIFLVGAGLKIISQVSEKFSQLVIFGIVFWIALQGLIHLGSVAILIPFTGMPFPFVSYGGSNLVVLLVAVGIVLGLSGEQHLLKSRK